MQEILPSKAGETVIAIESPLGEFQNTVTVGVVSATGRSLVTGESYQMEDLVQTDAAIIRKSRMRKVTRRQTPCLKLSTSELSALTLMN